RFVKRGTRRETRPHYTCIGESEFWPVEMDTEPDFPESAYRKQFIDRLERDLSNFYPKAGILKKEPSEVEQYVYDKCLLKEDYVRIMEGIFDIIRAGKNECTPHHSPQDSWVEEAEEIAGDEEVREDEDLEEGDEEDEEGKEEEEAEDGQNREM
ncbi:hypothetical protein PMAYCL1PPCAC_04724, partial [Pristionchus mayeri]